MPLAVEPVSRVFGEQWPQARITHLLDDSLPPDLQAAGSITPAIVERFVTLARYSEKAGANAILFTCSAFGTAIEAARNAVKVPVLKPNEAMLEEALAAGTDLGLIVTFEPSIPSLRRSSRNSRRAAASRSVSRPARCRRPSPRSSRAARPSMTA